MTELTKSQEIAAQATGKNILVSAGAGTGKTRVLVERFLYFVTHKQIPVTEILALTYTEKAANEMKDRILKELTRLGLEAARRDLESAYISTIHAFAARLLREHPLEAGVDPEFRVLESEESDLCKEQALAETLERRCEKGNESFELLRVYGENRVREALLSVMTAARREGLYLKEFFANHPCSPAKDSSVEIAKLFAKAGEDGLADEGKRFQHKKEWDWDTVEAFRAWCGTFSRRRGSREDSLWPEIKAACKELLGLKLDVFAAPWRDKFENLALAFEEAYESLKTEKSSLDFDDLEIKAVRLFLREGRVHARLRERYREKFRQILVDEFQDTNKLQLDLIRSIAADDNLFFVGDYKQSIYGFRGAEPRLFLESERAYEQSATGARLPLVENFRTEGPLLDFINLFFERLWAEDEMPFEPLVDRAGQDPEAGAELIVETLGEGEPLDNARMREADKIAERIVELREEGAEYGDMAILFQAMTDIGIYEQALKRRGVPYYAISARGFYHQPEIRDILNFLAFLENPLADIPLAAALRSPLFQAEDNTLFWLAHYAKKDDGRTAVTPLYEGVKHAAEIDEIPEPEQEKIRTFLEVTAELVAVKDRLRMSELLDVVLARTSYELTVLADPQGVRRYANMKKLLNLAREFEGREPLPLGAFLRTVRRLETQEVRESEAQIEAEQSGRVVRLLSVHRAKGLEFPIVFIADLGRSKQSSESGLFVAEGGVGYALQVRNEKSFEMEKPATWSRIRDDGNRKGREEWKRLFYVAATRAKKKLILSGAHRERKKGKESFHEMATWMDWVLSIEDALPEGMLVRVSGKSKPQRRIRALAEKRDLRDIFGDFRQRPLEDLIGTEKERRRVDREGQKLLMGVIEPHARMPSRVIDLPVSAYVTYAQDPKAYWRIYELGYSVSQDEVPREALTAVADEECYADFGTAMHRVLENVDFSNSDDGALTPLVQHHFRHMSQKAQDEAHQIVKRFVKGDLFKRLARAKRLYRELPFVLNERHGVIHGVIDLLIEDSRGSWHILDYKTAVGDEAKVVSAGYAVQIEIYAHAVNQIMGVRPSGGMIHFLKNDWTYRMTWDVRKIAETQNSVRALQERILEFATSGRG
ncbi:MAG: UvrD-helicase domain-containing protein [Candidatus Omnitrophota bacterium]|nr:UvrD-helicase domain-containing protein [Candidatus Omnitrophota bacterium]